MKVEKLIFSAEEELAMKNYLGAGSTDTGSGQAVVLACLRKAIAKKSTTLFQPRKRGNPKGWAHMAKGAERRKPRI